MPQKSIASFFTPKAGAAPARKRAAAAAPAAAAGGASAGGGGGHGVRGDAKRARQAGGGASAGPGLPAGPCGDRASRQKAAALAIKALRERTAEAAAAQAAGKPLGELLVEAGWKQALGPALSAPAFGRLEAFVAAERAARTPVYPPAEHTFAAFHATPLSDVRVVVLGQDPYHGSGQAMGLSFSVPRGEKIPSSLQNIFKELNSDLGCTKPAHGDLTRWAAQGVLLLNTVLTVREAQANSHKDKGWEAVTDAAVRTVSKERTGVVFLLWGAKAQAKEKLIDKSRGHSVLKCPHPSGLSAHRGFYGCKHFSKANDLLGGNGHGIDWQL